MSIIQKYDAIPLDTAALSTYEKWALQFFHDKEHISNPNLEMTLQLDVTDADKLYRQKFSNTPGASFTAYLYFGIIQTLKEYPPFSYRDVDGVWHHFKNAPLFFPIAIGGRERFYEAFIENVCQMNWTEFTAAYRKHVDESRSKQPAFEPIPFEAWDVAVMIGNLPNLQFTSLHLSQKRHNIGKPVFYLGQRYEVGTRKMLPFYVQFDHANLDPQILASFVASLMKNLA